MKISFIDLDKSQTTPIKVIQVNRINFYVIKLHNTIKKISFFQSINSYHFLNLFIITNYCISPLNYVLVLNNLKLIIIRDMSD